jgi:hypothetical protein
VFLYSHEGAFTAFSKANNTITLTLPQVDESCTGLLIHAFSLWAARLVEGRRALADAGAFPKGRPG